jgi:hypothetical protein
MSRKWFPLLLSLALGAWAEPDEVNASLRRIVFEANHSWTLAADNPGAGSGSSSVPS